LAKLASDYPIGAKLLAWRELSKLKSTYLDALPKLIDPRTGRIHTTFNQVGTTTGRLASEKPNLQNIPVKGEWGAKIRRAFVAGQDSDIVAADYSQIELRILASLADDRNMLDSFAKGLDIHSATAAEVSGVAIDAVTAELRRLAKAVNFGLVYGMRAYGLSERAGITPSEAEAYISAYFERYAGIRAFLDSVIEQASRDGYVQTVLGRRRYVRELASPDFNTRKQGERFAVNAVIQGSAADIIKLAMVKVDDYLRGRSAKSRMFLQVHDELLFEAFSEEIEELKADVKRLMEGAYELKAPLAVNIGSGKTWGDIEK
jgi:DNA polymerase-1